jgi:hypothetical protein
LFSICLNLQQFLTSFSIARSKFLMTENFKLMTNMFRALKYNQIENLKKISKNNIQIQNEKKTQNIKNRK